MRNPSLKRAIASTTSGRLHLLPCVVCGYSPPEADHRSSVGRPLSLALWLLSFHGTLPSDGALAGEWLWMLSRVRPQADGVTWILRAARSGPIPATRRGTGGQSRSPQQGRCHRRMSLVHAHRVATGARHRHGILHHRPRRPGPAGRQPGCGDGARHCNACKRSPAGCRSSSKSRPRRHGSARSAST